METILLGFHHLRGPHLGENIAKAVLKVIYKYGLTGNRIGWFVLNNITSNDTYVVKIIKALSINNIVEHHYLHYLSYIINFSAKAFLFSLDPNAFENKIEITQQFKEERKQ